jgi:hypothetical protein
LVIRRSNASVGLMRYLLAEFENGDAALMDWLCIGEPGRTALAAGGRYVHTLVFPDKPESNSGSEIDS